MDSPTNHDTRQIHLCQACPLKTWIQVVHGTCEERNVTSAVGLAGHVERPALELDEVFKENSRKEGYVDRSVLSRALEDGMEIVITFGFGC
jgi:hypothetical protein